MPTYIPKVGKLELNYFNEEISQTISIPAGVRYVTVDFNFIFRYKFIYPTVGLRTTNANAYKSISYSITEFLFDAEGRISGLRMMATNWHPTVDFIVIFRCCITGIRA